MPRRIAKKTTVPPQLPSPLETEEERETNPNADWDTPWKALLEAFLRPFLAFFTPSLEAKVDWEREQPYEFLDKEFQKLTPNAETGRRFVDKLIKLYLVGGGELWMLAHVEVQGEGEAEFPHRMFIYHVRITDTYNHPVFSLAILTDDDPKWRPSHYEQAVDGTKIRLDFSTVKLLDYRERWAELEASDNPFALVVMAHLKAMETAKSVEERYHWKWELTQLLHQKGYAQETVVQLYGLLDWLMALPKEASRRFEAELSEWEEKRSMGYITSYERHGIEKGIIKGRQEGQQETLLKLLYARFQELPEGVTEQIRKMDQAALDQLTERIITAQTLAELGLGSGNGTITSANGVHHQ